MIGTVRVATGSREALHRLPVAASVLDARAIARIPALASDDLLRVLPGFDRTRSNSGFTNYGQLRVSFTGAGTDRGLLLVDAIPAQDGFGGQVDWAAYPAADITRAELLRGAGSALYGAGAVGGVLALDTAAPPATHAAPHTALQISAGSHGAFTAYARSSASLGSRLTTSLSLEQNALAYDDLAPGYRSPIDQRAYSRSSMASLRLRYALSSHTLLDYGARAAWDIQNEGRPNYDFRRRFTQHALTLHRAWQRASLTALAYAQAESVTNRADQFPQSPGALRYTQAVPSHDNGLGVAWSVDAPESTFQLRADARFTGGSSTQLGPSNLLSAAGSGTQAVAGLAVAQTWRLPRAEIDLGARGDLVGFADGSITRNGTSTTLPHSIERAISPRLALRYDLSKRLALRISDGAGFRPPYLNELVRGYQIGSIVYEPNPDLVPERSSSLSAGLDYTGGDTAIALDAIHTFVNDAISFSTIDPTHQRRSNIAHTQTDGETLAISRRVGDARITASATAQYARVTCCAAALVGKRLPYVPLVSASVGYDASIGALGAGVTLSYLGETYADDLNTQPLGTALVAGLHLSAPLRPHGPKLLLTVTNLTGARYLSSIDRYGPPAVISLGLLLP